MVSLNDFILEKLIIHKNIKPLNHKNIDEVKKYITDLLDYLHYTPDEDYDILFDSDDENETIIRIKFSFEFSQPANVMKEIASWIHHKIKENDEQLYKRVIVKGHETPEITIKIFNNENNK